MPRTCGKPYGNACYAGYSSHYINYSTLRGTRSAYAEKFGLMVTFLPVAKWFIAHLTRSRRSCLDLCRGLSFPMLGTNLYTYLLSWYVIQSCYVGRDILNTASRAYFIGKLRFSRHEFSQNDIRYSASGFPHY